eukprot:scaffold732_cov60-Phaeocystis_antarctica.AAC.28
MPCDTHSAGTVAVKESSNLCSTWPGLPFQRLGRNSGPVRTSRVASPVFAVTIARTTGEGPLPVSCTFRRAGRPPTSLNAGLMYSYLNSGPPTSSTCVCARYTADRFNDGAAVWYARLSAASPTALPIRKNERRCWSMCVAGGRCSGYRATHQATA